MLDHISKTKLVTTYKYHHGYFDGREREFRGFGRVDQFDPETFEDFSQPGLHGDDTTFTNNASAYHVPPVETRSWFHTGVYCDENSSHPFDSRELTKESHQEFYQGDDQAVPLADHEVETGQTPHEAYRSAALELDEASQILAYEEYYPYGSTSYQAVRSSAEVSLKRYRYTGMERDEESGLNYHKARYCASWLGRWVAVDPLLAESFHLSPYCYAAVNPIRYTDLTGRQPELTKEQNKIIGDIGNWWEKVSANQRNLLNLTLDAIEAKERLADLRQHVSRTSGRGMPAHLVDVDPAVANAKRNLQEMEKKIQQAKDKVLRLLEEGKDLGEKLAKSGLQVRPGHDDLRLVYGRKVQEGLKALNDHDKGKLGAQRGSASVGLMVAIAAVGVLAGAEDVRSVAKDMAVAGTIEYGAARVMGPKLGPAVTTFVLGMCSDQAGSCEKQASERAINTRIAKEFPGAYNSPEYCLKWVGWPCIEVFTGNEYGPGYAEAREKVEAILREEARQRAEKEALKRAQQKEAQKEVTDPNRPLDHSRPRCLE